MDIIRHINLSESIIKPLDGKEHDGAWAFIAHNVALERALWRMFGRYGLCLKVFKKPAQPLDEFAWGTAILLAECTKAQNLFAWHGHAPRVYAIVLLNGERWAQVTDFIKSDGKTPDRVAIKETMAQYRIRTNWDMNEKNFLGSQLVDFQPFHFGNAGWYEQDLQDRAFQVAAWGSRPEPYQAIDEWGVKGQRDMAARCIAMKWDEYDWHGKTVLDLGCNLGAFCRQAAKDGAKRAVGVDVPKVAELAYELSNWHGYWNLDFMSIAGLSEKYSENAYIIFQGEPWRFDVLLALSVDRQIGYGPWMRGLVREGGMFYLEGHVPDQEATYRERLERDWARVEFLGMTRDHGPRPLFRCWK